MRRSVRAAPSPPRRGRSVPALKATLRGVFGLDDFKPGQLDIIRSVMAGRDTVAILPTGAGKSLCYQLPALHLPGVTIVASPLIALIKDQVDKLRAFGIAASRLDSTLPAGESTETLERIAADETEFVLTTPERLANAAFLATLAGKTVDLFVVDEAHCVSQWGHDFRPAYLALRAAVEHVGRPPVLALTATAPKQVLEEIVSQLGLVDPIVVNASAFRSNLRYEVITAGADEKLAQVTRLLTEIDGAVIVYTATIKQVEEVAQALTAAGFDVGRYHGKMGKHDRHDVQDRFMNGALRVIVATNAFGMGIDKPDIRGILHYGMPGSLDAYYQESGRAGRDGQPSRCVLLYDRQDRRTQLFFMGGRYPQFDHILAVHDALAAAGTTARSAVARTDLYERVPSVPKTKLTVVLAQMDDLGLLGGSRGRVYLKKTLTGAELQAMALAYNARHDADLSKLEQMEVFAQTALCRWRMLLRYFGEEPDWKHCGSCDNCDHPII